MLKLDARITLDQGAIESPNLCNRFAGDDLARIGEWVHNGYRMDQLTRTKWQKRTSAAMDLAMQIQKAKNFPWPDCSNVAFPLVTIATLQFHATAYPNIVDGANVVRCRVLGEDPQGEKLARADRVSTHMSWQRLEEDHGWEEQHDRALINLSVVGTNYKKSYHDATKGCNVSDLVYADDLVWDYWGKSIEECHRKTHRVPLFRNDIYERVQRKTFRDVLDEGWYKSTALPRETTRSRESANRAGTNPPPQADETTPFYGLEQHCSIDLDGDGYAEPYIITIEEQSQCVLRIVTRFDRLEDIERANDNTVIKVHAMEYFTQYIFMPSPDGGGLGMGFGVLLGPLNESTNSLINQLIDTGTMQNTAGGFLGRGAKIRGGVYTFAPLEWKRVDATGDDLRKAIYPLPVRDPSAVLFNLLSLLINYTNRISGSSDAMVGENPGQNTPAETQRSMIEQGKKIYAAIFKRVWRSMKEEFKKLYVLNGLYLPATGQVYPGGKALREDYLPSPTDIIPAADPDIVSETQRVQMAGAVSQRAQQIAGYDKEKVERYLLRAWRVDAAAALFPGPKVIPPEGEDIKVTVEKLKQQGKQLELKQANIRFAAQLMEDQRVNNAKIIELQASALKLSEDAKSEQAWAAVAAVDASVKALEAHNNSILKHIDLILRAMEVDGDPENANSGRMASMAIAAGDRMATPMGSQPEAQPAGAME